MKIEGQHKQSRFRLPPEAVEKIRKYAETHDVSFSKAAEELILNG